MAQFVVRNLEDDVRDKLRELAESQGTSMEELVREILRRTVVQNRASQKRLGSRISKRFTKQGLAEQIPELRGQTVEPPRFES